MPQLRGNYKLTKKEILTVWEAEFPSRPPFSYVGTRELLRRDAWIATSRRRKMGIERGKEQAMESPGTGVRRGHRERAWVKFHKGQKVKRSKGQKSHLTKVKKWKWKGEYWTRWMMNEVNGENKVNEVNGEFGESAQFANAIFQRTEMRRFLNII